MMYQITVKRGFTRETWYVASPDLSKAMGAAEKRLRRAPRLYEGWEIESAERLQGFLIADLRK